VRTRKLLDLDPLLGLGKVMDLNQVAGEPSRMCPMVNQQIVEYRCRGLSVLAYRDGPVELDARDAQSRHPQL
jgi:hypothetical protein